VAEATDSLEREKLRKRHDHDWAGRIEYVTPTWLQMRRPSHQRELS
jgi:hypothetical protein